MIVKIGKTKGVSLMKKQLILLTLLLTTQLFAMEKDNQYSYQPLSLKMNVIESFQSGKMDEEKQDPFSKQKNEIKNNIDKLIAELEFNHQEIAKTNNWFDQLDILRKELNPSQKMVLTNIQKKIKNNEIINLTVNINLGLVDLPQLMMESRIRNYFENEAKIGTILGIDNNEDGIQLKRIVTLKPMFNEMPPRWYVKTHAGGLLRDTKKSTIRPVDPVELLTYKILEHSGYGTESHFFYDDALNFYIGTKDVLSYSDTQSISDYHSFLTKEKNDFTETTTKEHQTNIIQGLITSDILSRILRLTDIHTQNGNILFVENKDNWHLKIIDFRNRDESNYPNGQELFGGLVVGNGQFNYIGVDKIMSHYLGKKDLLLRIDFARGFDYKNLRSAVGKAEGEMYKYMNLKENFKLFDNNQQRVYEHCAAIQNIISEFEKAALEFS